MEFDSLPDLNAHAHNPSPLFLFHTVEISSNLIGVICVKKVSQYTIFGICNGIENEKRTRTRTRTEIPSHRLIFVSILVKSYHNKKCIHVHTVLVQFSISISICKMQRFLFRGRNCEKRVPDTSVCI